MAEYTADELADDFGDEKRLEKAERAAEHKAVKRRKKGGGTSTGGKPRIGRPTLGPVISAPAGAPPFHQPATSVPRRPLGTGLPTARVAGPCFSCREMGHIRLHCPKMAAVGAEGNRKWYPFDGDCEYSVPLGRGMEYISIWKGR